METEKLEEQKVSEEKDGEEQKDREERKDGEGQQDSKCFLHDATAALIATLIIRSSVGPKRSAAKTTAARKGRASSSGRILIRLL